MLEIAVAGGVILLLGGIISCFIIINGHIVKFEKFVQKSINEVKNLEKSISDKAQEVRREFSLCQEKGSAVEMRLSQKISNAERITAEVRALISQMGHLIEHFAKLKNTRELHTPLHPEEQDTAVVNFSKTTSKPTFKKIEIKKPLQIRKTNNSLAGKNLLKILKGVY
ncbi:MAG: hypothetical protein LBH38_01900 [Holosporales bacterium]|jgi:DNA repair exonuclease SbcCD ATPase subunit|nr:hypothetical protein [Holosporales bacterium]